jgi:hypothetical protein
MAERKGSEIALVSHEGSVLWMLPTDAISKDDVPPRAEDNINRNGARMHAGK